MPCAVRLLAKHEAIGILLLIVFVLTKVIGLNYKERGGGQLLFRLEFFSSTIRS